MKRNEYIGRAALEFFKAHTDNEENAEFSIHKALTLAEVLEEANSAPWQEPTEQADLWEKFPAKMKEALASSGIGSPSLPDSILPIAMIQAGDKGAAVGVVLRTLSEQVPKNMGIPAGDWEVCFRPVPKTAGLVRPYGPVA
jgi:hypothetical protein